MNTVVMNMIKKSFSPINFMLNVKLHLVQSNSTVVSHVPVIPQHQDGKMRRNPVHLPLHIVPRPRLGHVEDEYHAVGSLVNVQELGVERRWLNFGRKVVGAVFELQPVRLLPLPSLVDNVPDLDFDHVVRCFVVPLDVGDLNTRGDVFEKDRNLVSSQSSISLTGYGHERLNEVPANW